MEIIPINTYKIEQSNKQRIKNHDKPTTMAKEQ